MMKPDVGLYVHIPFCRKKCLYCDFCSFAGTDETLRAAYTDALCREIGSYRDALRNFRIDTIYFGGGTPSCLAPAETARILDQIAAVAEIAPDAEVTSEVNPATADERLLGEWRAMGFNRVSIGVQSFSDRELAALGRLHTADEAEEFVRAAFRAGFQNVGLDLMYGIPHETPASFRETLERAIALSPTHISAYSLQIEEGTPFFEEKDRLVLPTDEENADLYDLCRETLGAAGYEQYEISNYAKPGYASKHNLRYWKLSPYIGVGVSAYSYFEGVRYGHSRSLAEYLQDDFSRRPAGETETAESREYETVMLGLRLREGIDDAAFARDFGVTFTEKYGEKMAPYVHHGLAYHTGHGMALTPAGMYVSLGILSEILE